MNIRKLINRIINEELYIDSDGKLREQQPEERIDLQDQLEKFNNGELNEQEEVVLFSFLIKNNIINDLPGFYKRHAHMLITNGYLDENGTINKFDTEADFNKKEDFYFIISYDKTGKRLPRYKVSAHNIPLEDAEVFPYDKNNEMIHIEKQEHGYHDFPASICPICQERLKMVERLNK